MAPIGPISAARPRPTPPRWGQPMTGRWRWIKAADYGPAAFSPWPAPTRPNVWPAGTGRTGEPAAWIIVPGWQACRCLRFMDWRLEPTRYTPAVFLTRPDIRWSTRLA